MANGLTILIGLPVTALFFGFFTMSWVPRWLNLFSYPKTDRMKYLAATYLGIAIVIPLVYLGGEELRRSVPGFPYQLVLIPLAPLFFLAKYACLKAFRLV